MNLFGYQKTLVLPQGWKLTRISHVLIGSINIRINPSGLA